MSRRFTPEEVDLVRTLAGAGWTDRKIGARIERSHSSVWTVRHRFAITAAGGLMSGRRFTPEEIDLVQTLTEAGWTDREIAIRLGRHPVSVGVLRRRHSIPSGQMRRYTRTELRAIEASVAAGKTSVVIAREVDRSRFGIARIRLKQGYETPRMNALQLAARDRREAHIATLVERKRLRQSAQP